MTTGAISALLSGGALMMIRVPSSEISVTPMPCVRPRLPLTVEHFPVKAGLLLHVISAAPAAVGRSRMIATTPLSTAHLLQGFAGRLRQEQNGNHADGEGSEQPLNGRAMIAQAVIQDPFQGQRRRAGADLDGVAQSADRGAVM